MAVSAAGQSLCVERWQKQSNPLIRGVAGWTGAQVDRTCTAHVPYRTWSEQLDPNGNFNRVPYLDPREFLLAVLSTCLYRRRSCLYRQVCLFKNTPCTPPVVSHVQHLCTGQDRTPKPKCLNRQSRSTAFRSGSTPTPCTLMYSASDSIQLHLKIRSYRDLCSCAATPDTAMTARSPPFLNGTPLQQPYKPSWAISAGIVLSSSA